MALPRGSILGAIDAILTSNRELAENGELNSHVGPLPVVEFKKAPPQQQLAKALQLREQFKNVPDAKMIGIKVYAGGVLEYPSHGCSVQALSDHRRNGELPFDPPEFAKIAVAADK